MSETRQDQREVWSEVGRQFEDLGRVLKAHLSPDAARSPSDPTGSGEPWADATATPRPGQGSARDSMRRLGDSAQRFATQAGDAARDPVVRDTAGRAARTLGDAVTVTVETIAAELGRRTRNPRWSDPATPRPTEPPPVAYTGPGTHPTEPVVRSGPTEPPPVAHSEDDPPH